ncbi:MAG: glycosyltransferase [Gammaproteobacteria bacterium]|nr:glycosyltransferase [Gammaproteobacteria bacterium]
MTQNVLFIAGEYPPIKTIGRIRSAKFTEHLPKHGWNPIVLTVERPDLYDPALEAEIPKGTTVYRAPYPDIEEQYITRLKRLAGRGGPTPRQAGTANGPSAPPPAAEAAAPQGLVDKGSRLAKAFIRNWLLIPDGYTGWARNALPLAREICHKHQIDVVYTSLPPFSAARIGYALRKELGIPWVVDYRDLWYGDVLREWVPPLRQRLELAIERRWMAAADLIITVSEPKTEFVRQLIPKTKARFATLTNGYDTEVYEPLLAEPRQVNDVIDFTFTGRLFKNRQGHTFAEALGQLVQEQPELRSKVKVHILGGVAPEIRARYDAILDRYGIADLYEFPGDVSYQDAMRAQVQTDYLLLIVDTGETSSGVIPGKLFEYVAAKRPIFALTDPGATQEIIERAGIGTVVPATDVGACKKALAEVLAQPVPETPEADADYLARFERRNLTSRLAGLLDELSPGATS